MGNGQTEMKEEKKQEAGAPEQTDEENWQEAEAPEQTDEKKIHWFHLNAKYMSVCRYTIFVIFAAILLYMLISHWHQTTAFVRGFFGVLTPFLIGVLIAYFLSPLTSLIEKGIQKTIAKGKKRKLVFILSMIFSYVIVLGFITIAFVFIIPQMGQSIQELTNRIPEVYKNIAEALTEFQYKHPELDVNMLNESLKDIVPNLVKTGTNLVGILLPYVYSLSISIVKFAINILLGIIISVYMIYSQKKFRYQAKRVVYAVFSEEKGDAICQTVRECNDIFGAFLISKAIDSLIIGCLCCIVMNIIGLPYAVLLSVIVGITNMIPYFGPFIGAVPGVVIYLCTDWESAIIFAVMILVLQQFDGLILGPRLLGQSTGLSPIWVIFAITVGGAYFGVIGMFIGVPIVAVLAFLLDKLISGKLRGKKIKALEAEH
ncbi:MAG: AI-2E family transporter [Clostridiaceae bacterium]|nr:AI-2E family transporter [Clostridiaceae bacterium]